AINKNECSIQHGYSNKIRVCIDPRDLKRAIKREHYPMKTIEEVVARMPEAKVFSVLDATSGYWKMKLNEESSKLCTFNTPFGRYRFTRLPFGIKSAPEVFKKEMSQVLEDIDGAEAIVDDILVWGKDIPEHDARLKKILDRVQEVNLKLNQKKCQIRKEEIAYVGHLLTKDDLKNTAWHLEKQQEDSFQQLKRMATSSPVLSYYDPKKPVTLSVDASSKGLGAVLYQEEKTIAYASRALTPTQKEKMLNYLDETKETLPTYQKPKSVTTKDPYKALMNYRNTPLEEINQSPAQIMMGRRLKTSLATTAPLLKSRASDEVQRVLKKQKEKQKEYYDKHAGKELPPLPPGETVQMKHGEKWIKAKVLQSTSHQDHMSLKMNKDKSIEEAAVTCVPIWTC
ncbi:Hypothetical predicted protein, partial [Paramuricea clavata]